MSGGIDSFKPTGKRFFIGFDSDGCVFDTMEIKHKECFTPLTVWKFELQAVSRFARQCFEFVNLYSKWRGINRFPALVKTLELLDQRPEARARGYRLPDLTSLRNWIATEKALSNNSLKIAAAGGDALLKRTLDWSEGINEHVGKMVYGVPPFPGVRELLNKAKSECDMIVVSQTPTEALNREWHEHELTGFVQCICGQEMGSKDEHLRRTAVGHYDPSQMLVVGDAYGDYKAAQSAKALFFPILPGHEEESWKRLVEEGYGRFTSGTFAGNYQQSLMIEMERILPETPPWPTL